MIKHGVNVLMAREIRKAVKNKRRIPRMQKIQPPKQLERRYFKKIRPILVKLDALVQGRLVSKLKKITESLYAKRPKPHLMDEEDDDIDEIIKAIRDSIYEEYSEDELQALARAQGFDIAKFNEEQLKKAMRKVTGLDIFFMDEYLTTEIGLFAVSNAGLISDMADKALGQVSGAVFEGLRSGIRWEEIAEDIEGIINPDSGTISSRAMFIARDQTSKLNGQLNSYRQKELGITSYTWRTSGDERVRESHQELNGEVFDWDGDRRPPEEIGDPGEDYNCRCSAEPVLSDYFDEESPDSEPSEEDNDN